MPLIRIALCQRFVDRVVSPKYDIRVWLLEDWMEPSRLLHHLISAFVYTESTVRPILWSRKRWKPTLIYQHNQSSLRTSLIVEFLTLRCWTSRNIPKTSARGSKASDTFADGPPYPLHRQLHIKERGHSWLDSLVSQVDDSILLMYSKWDRQTSTTVANLTFSACTVLWYNTSITLELWQTGSILSHLSSSLLVAAILMFQ